MAQEPSRPGAILPAAITERGFTLEQLCEQHILPAFEKLKSIPPGAPRFSQDTTNTQTSKQRIVSEQPLVVALEALKSFNGKNREDLDDDQRAALYDIDDWNDDSVRPNITDVETNKKKVVSLIRSFSRVFLLGRLERSHIDFRWEDMFASDKWFGWQAHPHAKWQAIRIDPGDWKERKGVLHHKTGLYGTLFHESTHAYFAEVCCGGHDDGNSCKDRDDRFLWHFESQHPVPWLLLAAGIDIALENLCGMGVDLVVLRSLVKEYKVVAAPRLSAAEWKQFFELFCWTGVDHLVRKLRKMDFVRLGEYLVEEEDVMNVFVEEYEKKRAE